MLETYREIDDSKSEEHLAKDNDKRRTCLVGDYVKKRDEELGISDVHTLSKS